MCRWIAYRGETTALEHYVTEPSHSLVSQSIRALESAAGINGDGFGLGWYSHHPEPGLYREIRPAWSDENLRYLCRHLQSHLFFAHVRAATGTAISRVNCHPFASGKWMFMHNGMLGNWNRWRRPDRSAYPRQPLFVPHRHDGFGSDLSRHNRRRDGGTARRRGKSPRHAHRLCQSKRTRRPLPLHSGAR